MTDTLYRVELRHQNDHKEEGQLKDKGNKEEKSLWISYDWLCVWSGAENVCVNLRHRLGGQQRGEVYTRLSHNFHLLKASGNPYVTFTYTFSSVFLSLGLFLGLFLSLSQVYRSTAVPK